MAYPVSNLKMPSTMAIYNSIRQNAPYDIQQGMPELTKLKDFPSVGDAITGNPTVMNYFCNELVNRIAAVYLKSMTFNNKFKEFKKGFLEYGETVEEIWRGIAKVQVYNPELSYKREFQRNPPDIRTTFHVINWRVQYPLTVSREMLKQAFTSAQSLENFINEVIDSVYQAAEYDEYLLFKYMLIKAASHGKLAPISGDYTANIKDAAIAFRGTANQLDFPSTEYNEAHVLNNTPTDRLIILMDAQFEAKFDVEVLAAAFNMSKADYIGRRVLVDSFSTFDNQRFAEITADTEGTMIETVTPAELTAMQDVRAIILDSEWFQVYDTTFEFASNYLGSAMEWQYWLHSQKIVSHSPFHNAIAFLDTKTAPEAPATLTAEVVNKSISQIGTALAFKFEDDETTWVDSAQLELTKEAVDNLISIDDRGFVAIPDTASGQAITLQAKCFGYTYTATATVNAATAVGTTVTFNKGDARAAALSAPANLDKMTIDQLRAYAKENDIDTAGLTKKADILAAIKATD